MQLVLLALVAALSLSTSSKAVPLWKRTSTIQWVDCASNIPQPLQGTNLSTTLPSTLHCGRLDVPMDYTKPIGANNTITLGFSMYRPQNSHGLVNFNPGGPAAEVSSYAWQVALNLTDAVWFTGLQDFDFLAMDVRGSFSSNPLNCTLGSYVVPSSFPTNETQFTAYQAAISTYAQTCIDHSTPAGIVAHVGTADTVQDWNSLREALGYQTMHFLSWSYGTAGAALYASKYPESVGRFVLDGIIPWGLTNADLVTFQIKAVNRLLQRADAFCLNDTTCPFHAQGKGSVVQAFTDVVGKAASGAYANVTADDVRAMVSLAYLSSNPNFPALNEALFAALNGTATGVSYAEFGPLYTQAFVPVLPVICLDEHLDNNTFAGFESIRQISAQDDPVGLQYSQDLSLIALCGGWPYHAASNPPLPLNASMVLVTSDFDLNTPTESATVQWQQAPLSSLVVRHGDDHGTLFVQGPARTAEFEFLATGCHPQATNQTFVTVYSPGSVRGPIADPYAVPTGLLAGDMS